LGTVMATIRRTTKMIKRHVCQAKKNGNGNGMTGARATNQPDKTKQNGIE